MSQQQPSPLRSDAGFSLPELLISMALLTLIMGATLGGLSDVMKGNDTVLMISGTNNSQRMAMDMIVRDLLQVGAGLPASHAISIPSGAGSVAVRIPGPPGSNFMTTAADLVLPALWPMANLGPAVDGVPSDSLTVLMADNSFDSIGLTAVTDTSATIAAGPDIEDGPDRVVPGQLMMIAKGSQTTLVQVTTIDFAARRLNFANGDSLRLNQPTAPVGSLFALNNAEPADDPTVMRISRIRMISYYLDTTTVPDHPRLIRRVNNGDPFTFNNETGGTAVAFDVEALRFGFDINNGVTNPGDVRMTAADMTVSGACGPTVACGRTQIRKVNVTLTGRSPKLMPTSEHFRSTLTSQVSLRGMAFLDRYRS